MASKSNSDSYKYTIGEEDNEKMTAAEIVSINLFTNTHTHTCSSYQ